MKVVLVQGFIAGVCAASLSAASTAVPDVGVPFHDLFLSLGAVPAPTVTERSTNSSGVVTSYDWQDAKDSGLQVALTSLNGRAYRWGGLVWGAELALGLYNISPSFFQVGGSQFNNGSDATLNYRTFGANIVGGYEYGIMKEDGLRAFIEILPHIGGGLAQAENEVHTNSGYDKKRGTGFYNEYGIRVAGFLTERNWIFGLSVGVIKGSSKVKVRFDDYDTELKLKRTGTSLSFLAGYRF